MSCHRTKCAPFVLNGVTLNGSREQEDLLDIPVINWSADQHPRRAAAVATGKLPPPFSKGMDEEDDDLTENAGAEDLLDPQRWCGERSPGGRGLVPAMLTSVSPASWW